MLSQLPGKSVLHIEYNYIAWKVTCHIHQVDNMTWKFTPIYWSWHHRWSFTALQAQIEVDDILLDNFKLIHYTYTILFSYCKIINFTIRYTVFFIPSHHKYWMKNNLNYKFLSNFSCQAQFYPVLTPHPTIEHFLKLPPLCLLMRLVWCPHSALHSINGE